MIPNKVKVAGIDYEVVERDFIEINESFDYNGACKHRECRIEIVSSMNRFRKEQIFVHELLHAILNECGYTDHDEDTVNRMGIVLHQVLRDNKLYFGVES